MVQEFPILCLLGQIQSQDAPVSFCNCLPQFSCMISFLIFLLSVLLWPDLSDFAKIVTSRSLKLNSEKCYARKTWKNQKLFSASWKCFSAIWLRMKTLLSLSFWNRLMILLNIWRKYRHVFLRSHTNTGFPMKSIVFSKEEAVGAFSQLEKSKPWSSNTSSTIVAGAIYFFIFIQRVFKLYILV